MDPKNTAMPADFILAQMEWREALEEARGSKDGDALGALEQTLKTRSRALQAELADLLDARQDYPGASDALRKLRFMDKLLEEVGAAYEDL